MPYTVSEKFGDKPIAAWIGTRFKSYVFEHYGVEIEVNCVPVPVEIDSNRRADACSQKLEFDAPSTRG